MPLSPQEGSKLKTTVFGVKSHFARRKSSIKFLCVKTVSDKVVRHLFAYLSVYKWLVGDVPFYARIWCILSHPLQNADFQSIFARSASAVTPSKNFNFELFVRCYCFNYISVLSFNTYSKSTTSLPMSLRWTSYMYVDSKPLLQGWLKKSSVQNLNSKLR